MSSKSDQNRHRPHMIRVRMSDEEYKNFNQKLTESGQTMQSYVLNAIQSGVIPDASLIQAVLDLSRIMEMQYKQLRGIATNINQMAHNSNMEKLTGDWRAEERLQDMQAQVEEMRKECMDSWLLLRRLMAKSRLTER